MVNNHGDSSPLRPKKTPVYEGNPFIFLFWGTWGMFQGSVEFFLEISK